MKKLLLPLILSLIVMAVCAPARVGQSPETAETEWKESISATVPEETVADAGVEELISGISVIDDIPRYYQSKFPDREIYSEFCDLDGNGWGDLAVWYDGSFRALYLMEENYVLGQGILFERGFQLFDDWQDGNDTVYDTNIIGTIEEENSATIYKYYDVRNGELYLREALKYDGTGEHGKFFTLSGEDWIPIAEEIYRRELGNYNAKASNLKPIEEYYLR